MSNKGKQNKGLSPGVQIPPSASQQECDNVLVKPSVTCGYIIAKVPVVLAETEVQIVTDSIIKFPEPVLEIKAIRKHLKLTQFRLLLPSHKVFLKGFVRKNIQYATPIGANSKAVASNVRSLIVDIPFSCVTEITCFLTNPVYDYNKKTELSYNSQMSVHETNESGNDILDVTDFSQLDEISKEIFNDQPYCELMKGLIIDYNDALDREVKPICTEHSEQSHDKSPLEEGTFTELEEKMVIELTLKVLQHQQICVDSKDC
ncbi:CsxC family protein [Bacillus cereus]|uniref:CsxC family protein n=1 Tax=Bacillus cereus TaxID=1396 RepID=UPI0005CE29EB|nr:hypothetical protein [Bacillus cereus]